MEIATKNIFSFTPQSFLHFPNDPQKYLLNQYVAQKLFTNHNAK